MHWTLTSLTHYGLDRLTGLKAGNGFWRGLGGTRAPGLASARGRYAKHWAYVCLSEHGLDRLVSPADLR
jgi:hypothetical protein